MTFDDDGGDVWYADVSSNEAPMVDAPAPTADAPADVAAVWSEPAPVDDAPADPAPYELPPEPAPEPAPVYYDDYAPAPIALDPPANAVQGATSIETTIAPTIRITSAPVRSTTMATVSESDALAQLQAARAKYGLTTDDAGSDLRSIQHLEGHEGSGAVDSATIQRYIDAKYPAWAAPTASQGGRGGSADVNYDGLIDEGWYVIGASNDNLYFSQSPTGYADRLAATGDAIKSGPLSIAAGGLSAADLIRATLGPAAAARATTATYRSSLPSAPGTGGSGPAASPLTAALLSGTTRSPQTSTPPIASPMSASAAPAAAGGSSSGLLLAAAAIAAFWLLNK